MVVVSSVCLTSFYVICDEFDDSGGDVGVKEFL